MTAGWSYEIELEAEPRSVGKARRFIRVHLVAHHLSHSVDDIRLVVSELVTNAVAHAETPLVVILSNRDGMTYLEVRDFSTSPVTPRTPDLMDTDGRGLQIVSSLSQAWGTTKAGGSKSVWASFATGP